MSSSGKVQRNLAEVLLVPWGGLLLGLPIQAAISKLIRLVGLGSPDFIRQSGLGSSKEIVALYAVTTLIGSGLTYLLARKRNSVSAVARWVWVLPTVAFVYTFFQLDTP